MSKYNRPPFFTSPYSNISPPATSFDMARSSSRDSTASIATTSHFGAFGSVAISQPLSRSSSTGSNFLPPTSAPTSAPMRRSSSASSSQTTWLASPYRSCLTTTSTEANSYLSDDDLLSLNIPVEAIANAAQPKRIADMTIEEQIAHLRHLQEQEESQDRQRREQSQRRKQVRFQPQMAEKPRRPQQLKRRTTTVRNGLSTLNGPQ